MAEAAKLHWCGTKVRSGSSVVAVERHPKGYAYATGLQTCGQCVGQPHLFVQDPNEACGRAGGGDRHPSGPGRDGAPAHPHYPAQLRGIARRGVVGGAGVVGLHDRPLPVSQVAGSARDRVRAGGRGDARLQRLAPAPACAVVRRHAGRPVRQPGRLRRNRPHLPRSLGEAHGRTALPGRPLVVRWSTSRW